MASRDGIAALKLDRMKWSLRRACDGVRMYGTRLDRAWVHFAYEGTDSAHKIQIDGIPRLAKDQQDILKGNQRDMVAQLNGILAEILPDRMSGDHSQLGAASMSVFGVLNWICMWSSKVDRAGREDYVELAARIALNGLRGL